MPIRSHLRDPLGAGPSPRIGPEAPGEAGLPGHSGTPNQKRVRQPTHPTHTILSSGRPALPFDGALVVLRIVLATVPFGGQLSGDYCI